MWFSYLFFIMVGAISLAAAAGVVLSNRPVHSALFLLANFVMLAALYVTLDAQFLAAAQIIIYAGAIVILILFVIMLIGSQKLDLRAGQRVWVRWTALGLGLLLLVALTFSMVQAFAGTRPEAVTNLGGVPQVVGFELFSRYILPFEMIGVLLLVALIGALLLARKQAKDETGASASEK